MALGTSKVNNIVSPSLTPVFLANNRALPSEFKGLSVYTSQYKPRLSFD